MLEGPINMRPYLFLRTITLCLMLSGCASTNPVGAPIKACASAPQEDKPRNCFPEILRAYIIIEPSKVPGNPATLVTSTLQDNGKMLFELKQSSGDPTWDTAVLKAFNYFNARHHLEMTSWKNPRKMLWTFRPRDTRQKVESDK